MTRIIAFLVLMIFAYTAYAQLSVPKVEDLQPPAEKKNEGRDLNEDLNYLKQMLIEHRQNIKEKQSQLSIEKPKTKEPTAKKAESKKPDEGSAKVEEPKKAKEKTPAKKESKKPVKEKSSDKKKSKKESKDKDDKTKTKEIKKPKPEIDKKKDESKGFKSFSILPEISKEPERPLTRRTVKSKTKKPIYGGKEITTEEELYQQDLVDAFKNSKKREGRVIGDDDIPEEFKADPMIFTRARIVISPRIPPNSDEDYVEISLLVKVEKGKDIFPPDITVHEEIKENEGILFIFENNEIQQIPLNNLFVARDFVFTDVAGRVVEIRRKVKNPDQVIVTLRPVASVLQVMDGGVKKYGIKIGDRLKIENDVNIVE